MAVYVSTSASLNEASRDRANASLPSTLQEERHGLVNKEEQGLWDTELPRRGSCG